MRRLTRAERADARSKAQIHAANWAIIQHRAAGDGLYVARHTFREEDDSVTYLFESSFTLEGLAKQVTRRMREEGMAT